MASDAPVTVLDVVDGAGEEASEDFLVCEQLGEVGGDVEVVDRTHAVDACFRLFVRMVGGRETGGGRGRNR